MGIVVGFAYKSGAKASDGNVGVAPLLNFSTDGASARRWTAILDKIISDHCLTSQIGGQIIN